MGQGRSRTVQVLGAIGAPVLLFGACSFQPVSTSPSASSAPGPAAPLVEDRSLEARLRECCALSVGEGIAKVIELSADGLNASLIEARGEDAGAKERWVLAVRGSDGWLATTDQLPAYFYLASARVVSLGRLDGRSVFGFVAADGGSGGWGEELYLFKRAGTRLEPLGVLEVSSCWRASGFDELCGAEKPRTSRTVEVVRRHNQLIVSGDYEQAERTSPAGQRPVTYRHVSSPIEEVYALLPSGVERVR